MRIRSRLAVYCAKTAGAIIHKTGRGKATVLPGYVAKRIDPEILTVMSGMVRKKIIAVTGTNGKTTANRMVLQTLKNQGEQAVGNALGANLEEGIIAAFVSAADKRGRLNADYACIEVDELATESIFPKLKPDCVLITNLFRDQLDRAGEVDIVGDRIGKALASVPEATVVINGDDICSYALTVGTVGTKDGREDNGAHRLSGGLRVSGEKRRVVTFGVSGRIAEGIPAGPRDAVFCPCCGRRLQYDFLQYGHLGPYHCPGCGLKRPGPDVTAAGISFRDGRCTFFLKGQEITAHTSAPYSVYNTLSAYAVLRAADISPAAFPETVREFDYGNGRESTFRINNAKVRLWLVKNPVGFRQKLYMLREDPDPKDILIQINDEEADGTDVSWLWDVDFDCLAQSNAATVAAGGKRREDMGLCLKYNGIPCRLTENVRETVEELTVTGTRNLYLITNYSGLYGTGRMLSRLQEAEKEGGRP